MVCVGSPKGLPKASCRTHCGTQAAWLTMTWSCWCPNLMWQGPSPSQTLAWSISNSSLNALAKNLWMKFWKQIRKSRRQTLPSRISTWPAYWRKWTKVSNRTFKKFKKELASLSRMKRNINGLLGFLRRLLKRGLLRQRLQWVLLLFYLLSILVCSGCRSNWPVASFPGHWGSWAWSWPRQGWWQRPKERARERRSKRLTNWAM